MKCPVLGRRRTAAACLWLLALSAAALAQTFSDPGFTAETVATLPAYRAVGLTFAPDGRIFVWQKDGVVRVVKNGALLPTPFIDISSHVNTVADRGLLGLALDPNFASNGYVYLLYTYEEAGNPNATGPKTARLVRVQASAANPDVAQAGEAVILGGIGQPPCGQYGDGADCIGSDEDSHTIGTLRFAADGKLFVSVGDGASYRMEDVLALRSQNLNRYEGKILRINPDGSAPSDNPFYEASNPTSIKSKVYSYGLRNPYRFALHPTTGDVYIGDVGWNAWEEINTGRGANFGWPCYEGPNTQLGYQAKFPQCQALPAASVTMPLYTYARGEGSTVIGGTFYTGTQFPAQYQGNFFFADYTAGWIRRMLFDAAGKPLRDGQGNAVVQTFATSVNSPVSVELGPDGALYTVSLVTGQVQRIRYTVNAPPTAVAAATPTSGPSPLTVSFSSAGSSNPPGGALTYLWEFGDGATSALANPTYTYSVAVPTNFTARLTVTNAQGLSSSATVTVAVGNRPPVATITSPTNGASYAPGTTVTYQGTASDPNQTLSDSAFAWQVLLHHNDHIHPFKSSVGPTGSFVVESHGVGTYFYEIILTVTDAGGLSDTKRVSLAPLTEPGAPPSAWASRDVGAVGVAGSLAESSGTFTVKGSGADIWLESDGFQFVYQPLSGNGQITACVTSLQFTNEWAKAGVMIRETLAADARYAAALISADNGAGFQRRTATGGGSLHTPGPVWAAAPYWVRLVRNGDTFSGYQSADGVTWALIGTQTLSLPANVYVGLAVTAHNNAQLCTATFDNVAVSGTTMPPANAPPTVSLMSPANNATFTAPATITLTANATDSDGSVAKVEFFAGATKLGEDTSAPFSFTWSNVAAGTYSLTARATDNSGATTTSAPVTVSVNSPSGGGTGAGTGLKGEYFAGMNLTNLKLTRTDATVNFTWTGAPASGVPSDQFSVRWTGQIEAKYSETYTFYTVSDDGVRLWVNGQLLIDNWTDHAVDEDRGQIKLVAGQKYDIRIEFYDNTEEAIARLLWSSPSQPKQVVPASQLYPAR